MKAVIIGSFSEMASGEVQKAIGESRYNAIKKGDEHPMFIALRVGHEGISSGTLTVGDQVRATPKRWSRAAIEELANRLNFGTPGLFSGTHADRGKSDRPRRGDVLAGYAKDNVAGDAEALGIAYVSDPETRSKIRSGDLDAASVEGQVIIEALDTPQPNVVSVPSIEAVVLASRREEVPGFEGAGIVAIIQELDADPFVKDNPVRREPDDFISANPVGGAYG